MATLSTKVFKLITTAPKVMASFLMTYGRNYLQQKTMLGFLVLSLAACDVSNDMGTGQQQGEDPVIVDYPLAFIARSLPVYEEGLVQEQNLLDPAAFYPGARLIIKDRATSAALETDISAALFPDEQIDIKDLAPSFDGTKLLFALRAPEDPNASDNEQPTWNIWEYELATQELKQLIPQTQAELGQDVAPQYLPDGRIVFTSTRQKRTKAILLDENKAQYAGQDEDLDADAFNLHIYDPISENISQITFNPSHDLQPSVLSDGRILFMRWDNMLNNDQLSFYTIYPDGTHLQKLYGYNSQNTGPNGIEAAFWQAREIDDGQLLINLRERQSSNWGGDIQTINTANFTDVNTPNPQNPGTGSAQQSLSPLAINIDETEPKLLSIGGFYNSAFALNDGTGRFITSWSPCRLLSPDEDKIYPCEESFRNLPNVITAPPNFGLWVLNNQAGTLQPLKPATEAEMYTQAVVFYPKPIPPNPTSTLDDTLKDAGLGVVNIRNIYDLDGNLPDNLSPNPANADAALRPARFIRIVKAVAIPSDDILDFDRSAFGLNRNHLMRDIIGYVPIEPDGSAKFKVPANIPIMLNLIDGQGKRLNNALFGDARHENWLSVQAGETFNCVGCHDINSEEPSAHGRSDAEPATGFTAVGQTLAEQFNSIYEEARSPTIDILFQDIWNEPANLEPQIALAYEGISSATSEFLSPYFENNCIPTNGSADTVDPVEWQKPTQCASSTNPSVFAQSQWNSLCRITINYEAHIQPLWERDRRQCTQGADDMAAKTLVANYTCTHCHSANYKNENDLPLAPAGSLFLTREMPAITVPPAQDSTTITQDNNCNQNISMDYVASYRQLLNNRLAITLNESDGSLAPIYTSTEQNTLDENGEIVLNEDGSPRQTVIRTCSRKNTPMNIASAANSRFFEIFADNDPIHGGIMSASELRLIAEWLDIGAQYYNSPFDAPLDN